MEKLASFYLKARKVKSQMGNVIKFIIVQLVGNSHVATVKLAEMHGK